MAAESPPPTTSNNNKTNVKSVTNKTTYKTNTSPTNSTTTPSTGPLPKFFILHSLTEKTLGAMSIFLVDKCLQGLVGTVQVKKLRSGDLQVETPNEATSKSLMRVTAFDGVPISVTPHRTLNSSKGVIVSRDLLTDTEEDIQKNLESQGVISVKRIMLRRDGAQTPSNVHILTFNRPKIPDSVKAGYLRCTVRPYIPNPLRCFLCQRYGHSRNVCRGAPICARCAKGDHDFEKCQLDPVCANCQGAHPAYSRSCPRWQNEKAVQQYRVEKNVSYPEARRAMAPSDRPSYSSVLQKKMVASEVQTDVTVSPSDPSPILEILRNSSHTIPCSHCNPPRSKSTSTNATIVTTTRAPSSGVPSGASAGGAPNKVPPPSKKPVTAPSVGKDSKSGPQKMPVTASSGGVETKPAPQGKATIRVPVSREQSPGTISRNRDEMPAPQGQAPKKALESERAAKPVQNPKANNEKRGSDQVEDSSSSSDSESMVCEEGSSKRALSPCRESSPCGPQNRSKKKGRVKITPP